MKIRTDFVTNSSSVSYICAGCGTNEAGSDCCSMEDFGFVYCERGHCICDTCFNEDDVKKQKDDWGYEGRVLPPGSCPICSFNKFRTDELLQFTLKHSDLDVGSIKAKVREMFGEDYKAFKAYIKDTKI